MRRMIITAAAFLSMSLSALAEPAPVEGQVTKINEAQQKITLKHGAIKNLDMDAMTMVFAVADPAMLKSVKVGDKVTFEADRVNGRITVTKIAKK
ncbi:copper-binding protein [Aestuariivirga sp. YIM B02566]|uniref:Copper-binding protein n=1 Tax=Taklimakanibacter albus TaxID=2800327 RepID=A0ACC5QWR5_9HYPH|nr:copper-binding protein [Aestuariivirga sp. YIM B02566]MBK1864808.1 copper-binding protein [Aestuariivirga sp. YIM B02566]